MKSDTQNSYRVMVEPNQTGRYTVRIEARFAEPRWGLSVFFQAATPPRVFARLATALRFLQSQEEQLWMWGSNASDRSLLFEEVLSKAGLELDQRREFPRGSVTLAVEPGDSIRAAVLTELKRKLAPRMPLPPRRSARSAAALARASA
ncbi:MAG: hypothetical protein ACRD5I_03945 [Candidatus Acidiferrales bacterium]